jgi:AAA15 family ATPase/GTPase
MTELEHIEIEGFKGLEHVEFEPTDINLITGRNNTGKTSFLEAIETSRDIEEIRQFGEKASAIVKRGFSEAIVKTTTELGTNHFVVRPASAEEKAQSLREAFTRHLQSSFMIGGKRERTTDRISIASYRVSQTEHEEIDDQFQETISKVATRAVSEVPDSLSGVHVVVELNGQEYPYIYFDKGGWRLKTEIFAILEDVLLEDFGEELVEEHPDSYVVEDPENEDRVVEFDMNSLRTFNRGLFLKDPPDSGTVKAIISERMAETIEGADSEDDAVRVDDIGDFIKEKDIVDQLKTFSLDTLIFETEGGEKEPVPYDFMGDGFKSMVGLLWKLMDDEVKNEVVLIEEPETHMHPGYIREVVYFLIKLAREEDIQLFITTHDSDFINDFFTENLTDEEEAYLEDEFSLLRMEEDSAVVEDYETASENLKDLHLDLRGI